MVLGAIFMIAFLLTTLWFSELD